MLLNYDFSAEHIQVLAASGAVMALASRYYFGNGWNTASMHGVAAAIAQVGGAQLVSLWAPPHKTTTA